MEKVIGSFQFDSDVTSVYSMVEDISEVLENYGLTLEVDEGEHDGFEVVTLKEKENKVFTREDVVKIVDCYAFLLSDNGIPYTDEDGNETCLEWFDKRYPLDEEND